MSKAPPLHLLRRPRVGLVLRRELRKSRVINFVAEHHLKMLSEAGGLPVLIPASSNATDVASYRDTLHGLLMFEGDDVNPLFYRSDTQVSHLIKSTCATKDSTEMRLCKWALQNNYPVLGICRGMQLLNVACNGALYADVKTELPSDIPHDRCDTEDAWRHAIKIVPDTPLHRWYQQDTIHVNSYHHQGIRVLAKRFKPMAFSEDGLIEAYYDPVSPFTVGLQFHPERLLPNEHLEGNIAVFRDFVSACRQRMIEDSKNAKADSTDNRPIQQSEDLHAALMRLCYAASAGDLGTVRSLLESGTVDVNACDYDQRTPLHLAASEGQLDVVQYLLSKGATVHTMDRWGNSPLDDSVRHKNDRTAELLKQHGAKLHTGESYVSALCTAACVGELEELQRLVHYGADVNKGDYDSRTPLHLAAAEGHLECVKFLLSVGARTDVEDRWGETPLMEAARKNHKSVLRVLVTN
ncbi:glutaminase [Balamuthia mandrillaris]